MFCYYQGHGKRMNRISEYIKISKLTEIPKETGQLEYYVGSIRLDILGKKNVDNGD